MQKINERIKYFLNRYFLAFLVCLGLISSLTYSFGFFQNYQVAGNIFRIIIVLFFTSIDCYKIILNKFRPPLVFVIFCSVYFLSNIIVSFISPNFFNIKISYIVHCYGIIQVLINILCILLGVLLLNDTKQNTKIPLLIIIFFNAFLCLFAIGFQFKDILNTFKVPTEECKTCGVNADVTSIYSSKTVFGFMLLLGVVSSLYLLIKEKRFYFLISTFVFVLFAIITRAKTSILSILILGLLLLIFYHKNVFEFLKKNLLFAIIVAILLASFIILIIFKVGPFFSSINSFIVKTLFKDGITVMADRLYRWKTTFSTLSKNWIFLAFGMGNRTSDILLRTINGFAATDNAYIYLLASGGFLLLLLYFYLSFVVIKKLIHKKEFFSIIFIVALLINGLFETNFILGLSYNQLLPLTMIFLLKNNQINSDLN